MAWAEYEKFWDKMSCSEEVDLDDERVNRLLRFKVLKNHLTGVHRILDVGGGTGAFSVPLAQMGFDVVHLDLSEEMIKAAKEKAAGLSNIRFIKHDASRLDIFRDDEFDLVLCFDGAISFSGSKAGAVISEICRVGKKAVLSVSSKSCVTATWLNYCLSTSGKIHPSVRNMMETVFFNKADYDDADELTSISEFKAYDVDELRAELEKNGMDVLECRSIGSLTHLYLLRLYLQSSPDEVRGKINELAASEEFLEICDYYDKYVIDYAFFGVDTAVSGVAFNLAKALKTPSSVVLFDPEGKRQIYCDLKDIQETAYDFDTAVLERVDLVAACNINFNRPLLHLAKQAGKMIATDVHVLSNAYDDYNREFMECADILFLSDAAVGEGYQGFIARLAATYPCRIVVMGRGAQGAAMYLRETGQIIDMPAASAGAVVNTVGAGDALFASFLHFSGKGYSPVDALRRAQVFTAHKITVSGSAQGFVTEQIIEAWLSR